MVARSVLRDGPQNEVRPVAVAHQLVDTVVFERHAAVVGKVLGLLARSSERPRRASAYRTGSRYRQL